MEERLKNIPAEFQDQHLFCLWLYDQMLNLSKQVEATRAHWIKIDLPEPLRNLLSTAPDKHQFLLDNGHENSAKRLALNSIIIHLFWDMYPFILAGLKGLEKRHYTLAFAMLRKPLKISMMFATWICADPDDFYQRLKASPSTMLRDGDRNLSKIKRRHLLDIAVSKLPVQIFNGEVLYNAVFDHKHPNRLRKKQCRWCRSGGLFSL